MIGFFYDNFLKKREATFASLQLFVFYLFDYQEDTHLWGNFYYIIHYSRFTYKAGIPNMVCQLFNHVSIRRIYGRCGY